MKLNHRFDDKTFFAYVRKAPFGGLITARQVEGCIAIVNAFCDDDAGRDLRHVAYGLATAYHETAGTMLPIREYGKGKGKKYGKKDRNKQVPYGRGYVQLTWAENYEKADAKLGLDGALIKNYDLALDKEIAAQIMVRGMVEGWFTGKRLSTYFGKSADSPTGARKIINGTDKAQLIATYHIQFLGALQAAEKAADTGVVKPEITERAAEPDTVPVIKSKSIWAGAVSLISGGGFSAFSSIDNPWAFATLAAVIVVVAIGGWLILSGRIQINRARVK